MVHETGTAAQVAVQQHFPNIVSMLAAAFHDGYLGELMHSYETVIFAWLAIGTLVGFGYFATRKANVAIPGTLQNVAEFYVGAMDDFVCGVLGKKGRKFTPLIGTLFIYILIMNYMGLVPMLASPTADWSTTMGLSIVVFFVVQYTAFKEFGFFGVFDHMAGKPRGVMAFSLVLPLFMFTLHFVGEFIRPLSLSLRLRSNVWGDDMLMVLLAGFGFKGIPLFLFSMCLTLVASAVQAMVFSLLSLIYLSLILTEEH